MPFPRKLLIEGNIGAGKSTLCSAVRKCAAPGVVETFPEQVSQQFLELFYSNKKLYAFAFQLHMMESRSNATKLRIIKASKIPECRVVMLDRSMLGDYVFAVTNYITGAMKEQEFGVYCDLIACNEIDECQRLLNAEYGYESWDFVYLHSDYRACKFRVDTDRKTCEKGVLGAWYYEVLEQVYFNTLMHLRHLYGSRIRVLLESDYFQNGQDSVLAFCEKDPPKVDTPFFDSAEDCGPEFDLFPRTSVSAAEIPEQVDLDRMQHVGVQWYGRAFREQIFTAWGKSTSMGDDLKSLAP